MNDATERGINKSISYRSKKFQLSGESIEKVYLTESELESLANLDLSKNTRLERVRDLFLIDCWTGLIFSDLERLTEKISTMNC